MSLLLDALQRSQNKAKSSASTPAEEPALNVLPPDAPGSIAAAPDTSVRRGRVLLPRRACPTACPSAAR